MVLEELKVLYVEDEKELRDVMKDILSDEVDILYVASDGEEAYKIYKEYKPNIVISDINMPKMNGIELIKKIRQRDQTIRAIMLTAYSDVENLLAATELKLTKYVLKPTKEDDLFDALDLAVEELSSFRVLYSSKLTLKENFKWDFDEQILSCNNQDVHLTPKEKKILQLLFSNLNSTITYDMLIDSVWEDDEIYSIDSVKTMIKNLRKKLPKDTILNVYGVGFKVVN
jgi:DNA-binding response OmpR family regulator